MRIPFVAGEIEAEHGGGGLGFFDHPQRQIGFGQPVQCLGYVGRGLIIVDDRAEAVDGGDELAALQIKPADLHFLSRQMLDCQVHFQARIPGIFGLGIAQRDPVQD